MEATQCRGVKIGNGAELSVQGCGTVELEIGINVSHIKTLSMSEVFLKNLHVSFTNNKCLHSKKCKNKSITDNSSIDESTYKMNEVPLTTDSYDVSNDECDDNDSVTNSHIPNAASNEQVCDSLNNVQESSDIQIETDDDDYKSY
ncbi:hypothetical protein ACJJTC_004683 [Scirpophaga incertulas]